MKVITKKIIKKTASKFNITLSRKFKDKKIKVPFINGVGYGNYFLLHETWLDDLIRVFVIEKEKTFVDVGVNIGQTLLRVKTALPDIEYLGFEPNSTCTSYSQQLIRINKFKNCVIQNCALSSKTENLILQKTTSDDSSASVVSELRPNFFKDHEHVLALDFQSFYFDKNISFVKIDVEGAEYEVLFGMKESLLKNKPIVTCEVLDGVPGAFEFTQKRASLVCKFLKSIDYSIIQLILNNNDKIESFKQVDDIKLELWTPKSLLLNDYIFYPKSKEPIILEELNKIVN